MFKLKYKILWLSILPSSYALACHRAKWSSICCKTLSCWCYNKFSGWCHWSFWKMFASSWGNGWAKYASSGNFFVPNNYRFHPEECNFSLVLCNGPKYATTLIKTYVAYSTCNKSFHFIIKEYMTFSYIFQISFCFYFTSVSYVCAGYYHVSGQWNS